MPSPLIIWENAKPVDMHEPVLVCGLEGWIDAGFSGLTAIGNLKLQIRTHRLVRFDTDELIDQRARRPRMRLVDGVNTGLVFPRLQIRHGRDTAGQDVLVLTGPEPDFRWNRFTEAVMELVDELGVRMLVGLGAFPAPYPHTRPTTLGSTATTAELATQIGHLQGGYEIPAGVSAALERAFADVGKPAVGIWARVPHYVATMPYPAASAALLDALARVTGLVVDTAELHRSGSNAREQIDGLIANNPEHLAMVRQLEAQLESGDDHIAGQGSTPFADPGNLPSGDELAAELERYLRDQ